MFIQPHLHTALFRLFFKGHSNCENRECDAAGARSRHPAHVVKSSKDARRRFKAAPGGIDTGTTIMAVTYGEGADSGVIVGADSRTSTGSYVANRVSDKITPVHDSIFCCRSGSTADTQAVADYVRHYLAQHAIMLGEAPPVKTAAHLFQKIVYSNKDKLSASIICAGWDPIKGGSVYCVPLGGALVKQDFAIGGSGSTYIYGLMDASYKPGMGKEDCIEFVKNTIAHAMARDGSSGGIIRLASIDRNGVERHYIPGDRLPFSLK